LQRLFEQPASSASSDCLKCWRLACVLRLS